MLLSSLLAATVATVESLFLRVKGQGHRGVFYTQPFDDGLLPSPVAHPAMGHFLRPQWSDCSLTGLQCESALRDQKHQELQQLE